MVLNTRYWSVTAGEGGKTLTTDGQLIASYLGGHLGVEFRYDLGVTLVDGPASITGATVAEDARLAVHHVAWMVTSIEFVQ